MRRAAVAMVMVLAMAAPASAATDTVQVVNFRFDPPSPAGVAGDFVTWEKASGPFHNVSSTTAMFRSGAATSNAFTFTRRFSAGTYPYRCEIHFDQMTGRVRIRPLVKAGPRGLPFTVRWANSATNTGKTFRVHYRVNNGTWRTWRSATSDYFQVFGAGNSPVRVVAGNTYRFRVRSTLNGNSSGYSPVAGFTP